MRERRRDQSRGCLAVRAEAFAIQKQLRIELAGPPSTQHGLHSRNAHAEQIGNRLKIWRESDNSTDVQIAIRVAVEPVTNAGHQRIVHSRVT